MTPCPHCSQPPSVDRCEPWPSTLGAPPWHIGCYQGGNDEHYIGVNGDTKDRAIIAWEQAVAEFLATPAKEI